MRFVALAVCLTLISYGMAVLAGAPLVVSLSRRARSAADPDVRAQRLFSLRLLPLFLGVLVSLGFVLPSFLWLEPRSADERVGTLLVLLAAASAAVIAVGVVRGCRDLLATRRLVRHWIATGRPVRLPGLALEAFAIDEAFPLVTIAGFWRPRLFVSSSVLKRCTSAELDAIAAHESGHLRRGDPWKRFLMRLCPDVLALTPFAGVLERSWSREAERAADDHASANGEAGSLDLASALLKVARLAGNMKPHQLPLTALYRGDGVAGRVARLIERSKAPVVTRTPWGKSAASLLFGGSVLFVSMSAYLGVLDRVHQLLEVVVKGLG